MPCLGHSDLIHLNLEHIPTGVYISVQKLYLSPPPFWKWYFFPLSRHIIFGLPLWLFCLNSSLFCIYFTLLLPLSSFSFPFLPFSFPFLPFSCTFSPFFSSPFHIFPPNDIGWYSPPPGGRIFQYIDPCIPMYRMCAMGTLRYLFKRETYLEVTKSS